MRSEHSPSRWKRAALRDCCFRPEYGYTASAIQKPVGPKFLRITDIQDGQVEWNKVPYVEKPDNGARSYLLETGDIVIARIGATTGKAFLIQECPEAVFASYLIRLRTKPGLLAKFLNYCLQTSEYWQHIDSLKGGRLKGGVNIPILENLEIPLPPPIEQRAIASALDTVQKAKGARQHELALERERKAALMEYLFTHGTRGEPTKQTEIGETPESWKVKPLSSFADLVSGGTPSRENADWWKGTIPWASPKDMKSVRLADTQEHVSEEGIKNGSRLVPSGTIFIVIRGMILAKDTPIGLAEVPMAFNQDMKAVLRHEEQSSEFLLHALIWRKDGLAKHIGTSAHGTRRISTAAVDSLQLPVPPLDEQIEIARILGSCEAKIVALEREIPLHEELFKSLLEELMTGRLSAVTLVEEKQTL